MGNRLSERHKRRPSTASSTIMPRTAPYQGSFSVHATQNPIQLVTRHHVSRSPCGAASIKSILAGEIPEPTDPPIYALTSLSPSTGAIVGQRNCIKSWRLAGLRVVVFNHPSEIANLQRLYDGVDFVPVEQTAINTFGKHYVHISVMLRWAEERDASVLLINSDIVLSVSPSRMEQLRSISSDGLAHISRHNHSGDISLAVTEQWGLDGFLFRGKNVAGIHSTLFAMGQPAWDWWLPYMFMVAGKPLYSVCGHGAYHQIHPINWSNQHHRICASELARIARKSVNEVRQAIGRVSKEIWVG